jgi:hypothetical protein
MVAMTSQADGDGTATGQIAVFLLDDHEIVRRGVRDLLEAEPDIKVVGEAGTASAALARIPALISFPPAAAFAHPKAGTEITPSMIPSVSQYAGQQMLTGQQAEAYADHFIAVHIAGLGGGKTYSQLSTEAQAQPSNTQLAGVVSTVFKGETLRSMLLNAYGWWKVSQITYIISLTAFGLGTVSFLGGLFGFASLRHERKLAAAKAPVTEQISEAGHEAGAVA